MAGHGHRTGAANIDAHLLRLRARDTISVEEEAAIRAGMGEARRYPADQVVIRGGEELSGSTLLIDGYMARYKDLSDGRRQITQIHVPGDFCDLHSFTLKMLDHNILALTPCTVAVMPHTELTRITEQCPHLTRVYWFLTNLDAAIHREWELSLGQRNALSRVAALFCELLVRLEIVGLVQDTSYALPITQAELGECLGLTAVHVNRTLRELRERGLLEFRGGRAKVLDEAGLRAVAEFDPAYLYLGVRDR